jgi:thioesterase domain-containing protein
VLFEASTVAEMAERIDAATRARCLVPVQPGGGRPIFFCVHDVNGQVLNFRALAAHLGPDQPFYGIQSAGLDGAEMPLARIEDMAARYVAEIRSLQGAGPYHLGGYSVGGLIAYEMARQLRAAGHAVGLLALFDTYPHNGFRRQSLRHVFEQNNRLSGRKPSAVGRYLRQGLRNLVQAAQTALWRRLFGAVWQLHEMRGAPPPERLRRPIAANYLAIRRYRIKPYAGDAVLFAAGRYPWERADALEGWRALIRGSLRVRTIPGVHHEIVDEPHVRVLAQELSDALGESRANDPLEIGSL